MPASIFNGTAVKILKKILRFKDSNVEIITGDTDSPAVVAKSAPQGSVYIREGTSEVYVKQDNGSSTNWLRVVNTADLATKANVELDNILPTADVDFNGQKLVDVADPTLAQDAATMNYVDTQDALYIPLTQKAANNGVATLDAGGKIPSAQLPNTVMEFQGVWDAATNTPTLADGVGNAGDVYLVTVAGTQNLGSGSQTFAIGDWVVYSSSNIWQKSINSNAVVSVNGQQGVVVLTATDVGAATTELDNLGTTAINADLIPDADNTRSLGSGITRWTSVYALELTDSTATKSYDIEARTVVDSGNNESIDAENRTLSSTSAIKLTWAGTDNTTHASIVPNANNTLNLGDNTTRFNNVFASAVLTTGASTAVILGTNAELRDAAGDTSVDWPNRQLQTGATVKLDWSGTDINVNTRKVTNVVDPTSAQDAATKNYVDGLTSSSVATKTANYTLTNSDGTILADVSAGAFTLTLPTAVGITGKVFTIKYAGSTNQNRVTIDTTSSQTIDGNLTLCMTSFGDVTRLMSNGSNWVEVSSHRRVGVRAYGSTTAAVVGDVVLVQPSKTYDTYNTYNTGTGDFTVAESGLYFINSSWQVNAATFSTTQDMTLLIYVNGSPIPGGNLAYTVGNGAANYYTVQGSDTVSLDVGSVVTIILRSTVAGACTTNSFVNITKVA